MKNRINSINIKAFRGIKNLTLEDCGDVNVILGDNNCGKTSVLEAIQLLKDGSFDNFITSIKRNNPQSFSNFIYSFPFNKNEIAIEAELNEKKINYKINYELSQIQFNENIFLEGMNETNASIMKNIFARTHVNGSLIPQINGILKYNSKIEPYSFVSLDFLMNRISSKKEDNQIKIVYESPFDHFNLSQTMISDINKSESYSRVFIEVLRIFDSSINKVQLLEDSSTKPFVNTDIFIQCGDSDSVPLSVYGDGIKKVICIAGMIARAENGILLIDEIETSLHHSYFNDILSFLIKACKAFNIQLFLTTHSKEIIDVISKYYKTNGTKSKIQFYTIRKKDKKIVSRVLSDEEVEKMNILGVEVRD